MTNDAGYEELSTVAHEDDETHNYRKHAYYCWTIKYIVIVVKVVRLFSSDMVAMVVLAITAL